MSVAAVAARFDQSTFQEVVGNFPTGVVLITAIADDGEPIGMILGSFSSVSVDPPIVSFMPTKSSSSWARLKTASEYCVNVLGADQAELCAKFSRKDAQDKFIGVPWEPSPQGVPILEGVIASISCTRRKVIDAGDHEIVLADVTGLELHNEKLPLLYFQGGLGRFSTLSLVMGSEADIIGAAKVAETARPELERLSEALDAECTMLTRSGDAVVAVAIAAGPSITPGAKLGARLPLVPPLGALVISYADEQDIQAWLGRRHALDQFDEDSYRRRLQQVHSNGWSMDVVSQYTEDAFYDAVKRAGDPDTTPSQLRALRAVIAEVSSDHAATELDEDKLYNIGGLMVPIFTPASRMDTVLRVSQLPQHASGHQVHSWITSITAAARNISAAVAATTTEAKD
jgi:flavin reductase (DIM6/NTAB) family NADH-FMN oxidoreductase RutF/DNA-binding IclR family transcriptional regulator